MPCQVDKDRRHVSTHPVHARHDLAKLTRLHMHCDCLSNAMWSKKISRLYLDVQVQAEAEYDGVKPLLDGLPAQLPIKDDLPVQQPGLGLVDNAVAPVNEESLEGLPWEFIINKDARQEWGRMDRPFRSEALRCCSGPTQ